MIAAPVPHETIPEKHHRDVQGGTARAAIFGVSDGLLSNVSLILGVAGSGTSVGVVRLAGLAGMAAGAVSMAAGEYVSMQAQKELLERELAIEARELDRHPKAEEAELAAIYMARGVEPEDARSLAKTMMRTPQLALETHAREELGIDPSSLGSPVAAAASSFACFVIGALLPLLPWFFSRGGAAEIASIVIAAFAAVAIGIGLARFTGRSPFFTAARQLGIAVLAAVFTYVLGRVVGVGIA
jgi:VIT1/CCC1 family predicted Fe2+/Mn2+ transporter